MTTMSAMFLNVITSTDPLKATARLIDFDHCKNDHSTKLQVQKQLVAEISTRLSEELGSGFFNDFGKELAGMLNAIALSSLT